MSNRRISNAIDDLEDMVQEAVELADDIADQHQVEDIHDIIQEAKNAIQQASGNPNKHLMTTLPLLEVSDSSNYKGGIPSPIDVQETAHSHQNQLIAPNERLHREPVSIDWAYPQRRGISSSSTSSSFHDRNEGQSRLSSESVLLLPPQPIQTHTKDHVDFVLRPVARDQSRGRSRQRLTTGPTLRYRRQHERRGSNVRSRSRGRRRPRSSSYSQIDTSFDEEDLPAKMYGGQLTVRDQAQHHIFGLRRHHRRQPIARNWPSGKKRLSATIACINTALLGIIVGIYVRQQYMTVDFC